MRYAVLGATGAVGQALGSELARTGRRFRVVGRSRETLQAGFSRFGELAELHPADLENADEAAEALQDVETVFYTVGVPYDQFQRHPRLTRNALAAAVARNVKQFVHVSTVYPYGRPRFERVDEDHPRQPHTFKGRMRKEQEDLVLASDDPAGLRTTVLRPPDFYGPGNTQSYVWSLFEAAVHGKTANVIGPVDALHEFVFVPDLARTLLELSEQEGAYGRTWNLAGAGPITTREFAEKVFAATGRPPRFRAAGRLTLRLLGMFDPFLREVVEMHYLWKTPVLLDDRRIQQLIPGLKKTSYDDGIRQVLESMSGTA